MMTSKEWIKTKLSYDCLTMPDKVMLNQVLQDLDRLEVLEKENKELIKKADCCLWKEYNKISQENNKLKKTYNNLYNVINLMIDLTFDKHCEIKEVAYQQDKLVCNDLDKLKEELKKNLKEMLENE